MTSEIELRLVGAATPSGEIAAKDLAALAVALQELSTRIGRGVADTPGPGRTNQVVEELAQLRLSAIGPGSTVLRFSKGPVGKLNIDLPEQIAADDRFWDVVQAIEADRRPDWMTDLIAESAGKLVNALRAAAPTVIVAAPSRGEIRISSTTSHAETWTPRPVHSGAERTAAGWLEKVDLRSHEFRLRDAVDNTVDLTPVDNDTAAARRVGQWVVAEGTEVLDLAGRLVALADARVLEVDDPAAPYLGRKVVTVEALLASAPGPDPGGGLDLTEEEAIAFLEALRS